MSLQFRFDADEHQYIALDTGEILPHITGLLERAGLVDDLWFTEESSRRGQAVHKLTADYDLGALELEGCVSPYRGYLVGYATVKQLLAPITFDAVEEPRVHPRYRFGGRPDRVGRVLGPKAVLEIKSGAVQKSHQVQTALQAILVADELLLPARAVQRFAVYVGDRGRYKVEQHKNPRDFDEAERILRRYCNG